MEALYQRGSFGHCGMRGHRASRSLGCYARTSGHIGHTVIKRTNRATRTRTTDETDNRDHPRTCGSDAHSVTSYLKPTQIAQMPRNHRISDTGGERIESMLTRTNRTGGPPAWRLFCLPWTNGIEVVQYGQSVVRVLSQRRDRPEGTRENGRIRQKVCLVRSGRCHTIR